jgi:tetratricopeptide (TPR) repeat protein
MAHPIRFPFDHVTAMACLLVGGCASSGLGSLPRAEDVPRLELAASRDSTDLDVLTQLGAAYRSAARSEEARVVLERVVMRDSSSGPAVLFLGLTYEDLGDYAHARDLYRAYLRMGSSPALSRTIEDRVSLLQRRALAQEIHQAVLQEEALSRAVPEPYRLAVYPLLTEGLGPELQPLGRALTDLLVTDLAQTPRVTLLERAALPILFQELELGESERTDPSTAARTGRILRAGRVIQGRLDTAPDGYRLQATVVNASQTAQGQPAVVAQEDRANRLLEMQRRMAIELLGSIGVQLTPAERDRILRQRTVNTDALIAYGRGLEAADGGDFAGAAARFAEAARLDPGFTAARMRAAEANGAAVAGVTSTDQIASTAAEEEGAAGGPDAAVDAFLPGANGRDAASEVLGTEGLGRRSVLDLIIRVR